MYIDILFTSARATMQPAMIFRGMPLKVFRVADDTYEQALRFIRFRLLPPPTRATHAFIPQFLFISEFL